MIAHILGWLTVASIIVATGITVTTLFITSKEQRLWLLRLRVPKPTEGEFTLSSGADYVGVV